MKEPITVNTLFTDVSELAQGYVERVSADQLLLPTPISIEPGEWTQFVVVLGDGTPAFAGVGRCAYLTDHGEDAPPETRYDLLLDTLGFAQDSQAVFDHMVMVREATLQASATAFEQQAAPGQDPLAGEFQTEDLSAGEPEGIPRARSSAATGEGEQAPAAAGEIEQPSAPVSFLSRPVLGGVWKPELPPRPEPGPSTGLFVYQGEGLPCPDRPPRPDLDPSLWVTPAPRFGATASQVRDRAIAGELGSSDEGSAGTEEIVDQE